LTNREETNLETGHSLQDSDVDLNEKRSSIHNIYIVVDGVVVFHRVYGSIKTDSALVSGFLGAVTSLSRDITEGGTLKSLEMPPIKFGIMQVMDSPQVLIAAATDQDFPESAIDKMLANIAEVFLKRFSEKILTMGVKDVTDVLRDDVHEAIVDGISEVSVPKDPCVRKQRLKAILESYTSPMYSCPHYDLKLTSKCSLDTYTVRLWNCQGVAFFQGVACRCASDFIEENE
jgi:hypothetical protein